MACIIVQSLSRAQLFATPWTAACQASLSFIISGNLLKLMPIESMLPWHFFFFLISLKLFQPQYVWFCLLSLDYYKIYCYSPNLQLLIFLFYSHTERICYSSRHTTWLSIFKPVLIYWEWFLVCWLKQFEAEQEGLLILIAETYK